MAKLLQELREIGRGIENSVFVCSGRLSQSQDSTSTAHIKLHYESSDASVSVIHFPGCFDVELKQLVAASKPASFGRGQEEVLDPTYRDAVQMDASLFTTSLNVAELPILSEIQSYLAPDTQDIRARLYKLNIYGPGGFFKAHRDTPRGTQMFGSLVVCLPATFEGGEFVIRKDDVVQRFGWGDNPEQVVQWCAFYSDCEHEVLPVTKGHRVTLTYLLENPTLQSGMSAASQAPRKTAEASGNVTSSLAEKLSEALHDSDFAPNGVKLGFALRHGYIVDKEGAIPMLKGPDRMLKESLDRLGLKYAFVPVYRSDSYDADFLIKLQDAQYHGVPMENEARKRKFEEDYDDDYAEWMDRHLASLNEWEFVNLTVGARDGVWKGDDVRELMVSSWENYAAGAIDYAPDDMMDRLDTDGLGLRKAQEVVWIAPPRKFPFEKVGAAYGNEPSVENYYASACLIAWVPPSSERMSTEKET